MARFVFPTRAATASESPEPLSSDEDSDPDIESSRAINIQRMNKDVYGKTYRLLAEQIPTRLQPNHHLDEF